jgi:hypothetical protein
MRISLGCRINWRRISLPPMGLRRALIRELVRLLRLQVGQSSRDDLITIRVPRQRPGRALTDFSVLQFLVRLSFKRGRQHMQRSSGHREVAPFPMESLPWVRISALRAYQQGRLLSSRRWRYSCSGFSTGPRLLTVGYSVVGQRCRPLGDLFTP